MEEERFSFKKYSLKQRIMAKGYTQTFVANKLGLEIMDFKRKLSEHEPFTKEQIFALMDLIGIKETYKVLFFIG